MTHKLAIGSRAMVVDYWRTQSVGSWTADKPVAIQVAAHLENSDKQHEAKVTLFRATLSTDANTTATVLANDVGEFAITPPYSYGSAILVPAAQAGARTATVQLQFDLLVETAPGSHQYFRQTALDSITLTYGTATSATATTTTTTTTTTTSTDTPRSHS